jgi:tetratricopeptide (TPR) repeat protein
MSKTTAAPQKLWAPLALAASFLFLPSTRLGAEQILDVSDPLSVARNQAVLALHQGHLADAQTLEQKGLRIATERYGPTHPSLAPLLTDLASLQRHEGLFAEAESSLQWALALRIKSLGAENPGVADSNLQLSSLYYDWDRMEDARYFSQKALDLFEKNGRSPFSSYIQSLNLLGKADLSLGQSAPALDWIQKSVAFQEHLKDTDPGLYLQSLQLLSQAQQLAGHGGDAQSCLEKALSCAQKKFKNDSIEVGDASLNLGVFLRSRGQKEKAKSLLEASLKIFSRFVVDYFGYDNLTYVFRLAGVCQALENFPKAEDLLQRCLSIQKDAYGEKSLQVGLTLLQLSPIEKKRGEDAPAQRDFHEGLAILETHYPPGSPFLEKVRRSTRP